MTMLSVSFLIITTPKIVTANTCFEDCSDALTAADEIIEALQKESELRYQYATELEKALNEAESRVDELNRQQDAWYYNPWVVGILGVTVGVLAHEYAGRP